MPELLSLVLPLFNEEEVVPALLPRLAALLDRLPVRAEVIFVDDGSVDATARLLREAVQHDPRLRLLSLSRNFGHQAAITAGLDHAQGDAVVVMDADLQDPPEVVVELVARWQHGFDVVHARRRRRAGETWMKLLTARLFYRLFAAMAPVPTVPDSGDFRLMSRRVVLAMRGLEESHRFLRGLVAWVGFRQTVVEYNDRSARRGRPSSPSPAWLGSRWTGSPPSAPRRCGWRPTSACWWDSWQWQLPSGRPGTTSWPTGPSRAGPR